MLSSNGSRATIEMEKCSARIMTLVAVMAIGVEMPWRPAGRRFQPG
ncbi:MAG: hypothetical protein WKF58_02825 [Ilumatobacteraceae bacterium]